MILFQLFSDLSHPESTSHNGSGGVNALLAEDLTFVLQLRWTSPDWIAEEGQSQ